MSGAETHVAHNNKNHDFVYDYSFWSFDESEEYASQERVYCSVAQPLLDKAFQGYNTCLFAYGQTGSGKSYTMQGPSDDPGVIPRFCEELFVRQRTNETADLRFNIEISYFEIYNERIHDLLVSKQKGQQKKVLKVREHPDHGPYVEGLSTFVVSTYADLHEWLAIGNTQRATAATGMNDRSSRSHSVFTIHMTQSRVEHFEDEEHEHQTTSKINLIDLAGSERQSMAATSGQRLREGANINRSLLTLGKVISLLSEVANSSKKKKKLFIPYRDSILTWMLKESLGGNSRTAMIANISPTDWHAEETLSTLRYARQARNIVNKAKVNEDPTARIIRELRSEIEKLRLQQGVVPESELLVSKQEISSLRQQLADRDKQMLEQARSWEERFRLSEQHRQEEAKTIERRGVAWKVDNRLPNLVNLSEDPALSELLLYVLREGSTKVGRQAEGGEHDIQLPGALIADNHCVISNVRGVVTIDPCDDSTSYINGELLTEPTVLHHGDRVILGGDHYFRLNHPVEVARGRKSQNHSKDSGADSGYAGSGGAPSRDFEFARQELLRVQNQKLEAELENQRAQEVERMQQFEKDKQKTQVELDALQHKNQVLEQEVLASRRRLQMEAIAAQMMVEQSGSSSVKFLSHLEQFKNKLQQNVKDLEKRKQSRKNGSSAPGTTGSSAPSTTGSSAPSTTGSSDSSSSPSSSSAATEVNGVKPSTPRLETPRTKSRSDSSRLGLYKQILAVREANRMAQALKQPVTFDRQESEGSVRVRVRNTANNLTILITWDRFDDKLLQMREAFQGELETERIAEVFFDPADACDDEDEPIQNGHSDKQDTPVADTTLALLQSPPTPVSHSDTSVDSNSPDRVSSVSAACVQSLFQDNHWQTCSVVDKTINACDSLIEALRSLEKRLCDASRVTCSLQANTLSVLASMTSSEEVHSEIKLANQKLAVCLQSTDARTVQECIDAVFAVKNTVQASS